MKAVIIGGNGQLGSDLVRAVTEAGGEPIALSHEAIEVSDIDSVATTLRSLKPHVVFNTAAFHVVPKCEEQPQQSFLVNGLGALNVARLCSELQAVSVYFSTDYVFDGQKKSPYTEFDPPNPLNVYGGTKLLGEFYTLNYAPRSFVFRVSGIYGQVPCRAKGGNFVTTMLRLAREQPEVRVVDDEVLTPTPTEAISQKVIDVIEHGEPGLYHLTCEGQCSWYEFARVIFDTLKLSTPLVRTSTKNQVNSVRRPSYSVLENRELNSSGISPMPHWKEALVSFLNKTYSY